MKQSTMLAEFFYVLCALTRLGFFNISDHETSNNYVGLTTTLAGFFWLILFLLPSIFLQEQQMISTALAGLGILMVTPFKYQKPSVIGFLVLISSTLILIGLHIKNVTEMKGHLL